MKSTLHRPWRGNPTLLKKKKTKPMKAESPTQEPTTTLRGVKPSNNKKTWDQTEARRPRTWEAHQRPKDQQAARCTASARGVTHLFWSCVTTLIADEWVKSFRAARWEGNYHRKSFSSSSSSILKQCNMATVHAQVLVPARCKCYKNKTKTHCTKKKFSTNLFLWSEHLQTREVKVHASDAAVQSNSPVTPLCIHV